MLFILTNSGDATADYLAGRLSDAKVDFVRFDTDVSLRQASFGYKVGFPRLTVSGRSFTPSDIKNVWYRRPEHLKHPNIPESPEGKLVIDEWAEFIEGFLAHIPTKRWINHPANNVIASHKIEQLTIATQLGLTVPQTLITQEEDELRQFYKSHGGRIIVKPLSNGYIERPGDTSDSLIYTNRVAKHHLDELQDLTGCPTFFQEEILKCVDVRITFVDRDVHAVELIANDSDGSQRCDIRRYNMADVVYKRTVLPASITSKLRAMMKHYDLRFAAIDMAVTTTGEWVFFEINPNGQWAWLDLALATNISVSFVESFSGA